MLRVFEHGGKFLMPHPSPAITQGFCFGGLIPKDGPHVGHTMGTENVFRVGHQSDFCIALHSLTTIAENKEKTF